MTATTRRPIVVCAWIAAVVAAISAWPLAADAGTGLPGIVVSRAPLGSRAPSEVRLTDGRLVHATAATVSAARVISLPNSPALLALWDERPAGGGAAEAWYAVSPDGATFLPAHPTDTRIHLKAAQFDPLTVAPPAPPVMLRASSDSSLWIVQFHTPPLEDFRRDLAAAGVRIQKFLPSNAYIVRMDAAARQAVSQLPEVRWVGPFQPSYKTDAALLAKPIATVNIQVLERGPAQKHAVAARIHALGGKVESLIPDGYLLRATLTQAQLLDILRMDEVLRADEWGPTGTDMDIARQISGAAAIQTTLGFTGQGVRGEVMDNNLRTTHVDLQSPPVIIHGPTPTDEPTHGTLCFGIVFGTGTGNAAARGMLPGAEAKIFADKDLITNRYTHTAELVNPVGPYRAVFQSNAWGHPWSTQYTTVSMELDDILFLHDIALTNSMSNNGNQLVRPEAWGKNVIAVGGVNHQNNLNRNDDYWGGTASIGPAADGRIKPDVVHLYDEILAPLGDGVDNDYLPNFSGTSPGTSLVAGTIGLVCQMWHQQVFPGFGGGASVFASRPKSTTTKALLINTAYQYNFNSPTHDFARVHQGWGMPDLQNLYALRNQMLVVDATTPLAPLAVQTYSVGVPGGQPLRATLVFLDPAGNTASSVARINDLSLKVTAPDGTTIYWGNNGLLTSRWSAPGGSRNTIDTVENVFIENAQAGVWTIQVSADEINEDAYLATPQMDAAFSLVVSGGTPCAMPAITGQPSPQTVCAGGSASFTVAATGSPAPTYQWRKDTVPIPGATAATLLINPVSAASAGSYDCIVSGACGSLTSAAAILTVQAAPAFSANPSPQTACVGGTAAFTAAASGTPAPTFQWRKNSVNIPGATNATLSISGVAAGDAATYDCIATNTCGSVTSAAASLTVNTGPAITSQPIGQTVCPGAAASFTVLVTGSPAPTYQWRKNTVPIGGATSSTLTLSAVLPGDAGSYDCVVTSPCGSVTSSAAVLTVNIPAGITAHPSPQTVCTGGSATFTVAAAGSPGPAFQWRRNGANIPGATAASYTINAAAAGDAGTYDCIVSNICGSVASNAASLTVNAGPAVTSPPTPQTACAGASVSFSITATGTPAPTYQWRKDTVPVPGATAATLVINPVAPASAGVYDCVVTNSCGSVTSTGAALTVQAAPAITSQPSPQTVCAGAPASFTVAATGSPAPTFQWRKGSVPIPGATAATFNIAAVAGADAGGYDCVITNACGSVTSGLATLTVNSAAAITTQPISQTACPGAAVNFSVSATGVPAPTFQWRRDTTPIPGATAPSYAIPAAAAGDAGSYDCIVTNSCGSIASSAAALALNAPVGITTQPSPQTACLGASATFTVAATGTPAPTFQWRKNSVAIPGATGASLLLSPVVAGDAASYDCIVTNPCGSITSSAASLSVNTPPAIDSQPSNQTVCTGGSATFTVAASGSPAPTFQWRKNTVPIAGATAPSLVINPAAAGDSASYDCIVSSTCGSATSAAATLTVNTPPSITAQPSPQTACAGAPATFTVIASGAGPITYQWRKNSVPIDGATASSYAIPAVAPADEGTYDCIVTNACGAVTSTGASLTANAGPTITDDPEPKTIDSGEGTMFHIAAAGSPPLTFQWRRNGVPLANGGALSGVTTSTLSINPARLADAGTYDCVVSNPCGQAVSAGSLLVVHCRADWDGSLQITPADVASFVADWSLSLAQGLLVADYDGNGEIEPADVAVYVSDWFSALNGGC